jgi:hypothetical protein
MREGSCTDTWPSTMAEYGRGMQGLDYVKWHCSVVTKDHVGARLGGNCNNVISYIASSCHLDKQHERENSCQ